MKIFTLNEILPLATLSRFILYIFSICIKNTNKHTFYLKIASIFFLQILFSKSILWRADKNKLHAQLNQFMTELLKSGRVKSKIGVFGQSQ